MKLAHDVSLKDLNSFGFAARAYAGVCVEHWYELENAVALARGTGRPLLALGGGSNILFRDDFPGVCLQVRNRGIRILEEEHDRVFVRVAAGESWHDVVCWAAEHNLWGIENLAAIPGLCGAAPLQNIGAYGVELRETLVSVKAYDLSRDCWRQLSNHDCEFDYRSSRFRERDSDRFVITELLLELNRKGRPRLDYPGISEALSVAGVADPTTGQMVNIISRIRQSKLPDPGRIGNAGSFFKNPVVSSDRAEALVARHRDLPRYPHSAGDVKLGAAWMIDQCGWRGYREGAVGVSPDHALVLVHHGLGTGRQLWQLALKVQHSVYEKFAVRLEPEPLIL